MYIDEKPNKSRGVSVTIRESHRVNGKVRSNTLFHLSQYPEEIRTTIKNYVNTHHTLSEGMLNFLLGAGECERVTLEYGISEAVLKSMRLLKFDDLLSDLSCQDRDTIKGVIISMIMEPSSKAAMIPTFEASMFGEKLNLTDLTPADIYRSMRALLPFQDSIQRKLIKRHLEPGAQVQVDASSVYLDAFSSIMFDRDGNLREGRSNLIAFGNSKDKKKGKPQVNFAQFSTWDGIPLGIKVFPGNSSDVRMFDSLYKTMTEDYDMKRIVIVGDRGMITGKHIPLLKSTAGLDFITALRHAAIARLIDEDTGWRGVLDERNMVEFEHGDYPEERLVACRNPIRGEQRRQKGGVAQTERQAPRNNPGQDREPQRQD
jgi:hypothetical protein